MTRYHDAVRSIHPMKHRDFTFGLTDRKNNAHTWGTREDAEAFASGIKESCVEPFYAWYGRVWVVRVGPWMYAHQVQPNDTGQIPAAGKEMP